MNRLLPLLLICLAALLPARALAAETAFVSGDDYQIRCISWPAGAIAPSPANPKALVYSLMASDDNWWTITKHGDGSFSIRNAHNGRYFTFDGNRTSDRRYMYLSTTDHGSRSRWAIYVSGEGLGVRNRADMAHYLNVRKHSFVVGTYVETATILTDNERFFLVNRKGRVVTRLEQRTINLPDACFDDKARARSLSDRGSEAAPEHRALVQPGRLKVTINGRRLVYDSSSETYFFAIPDRGDRQDFVGKLAVESGGKRSLFVDGKPAAANGKCRFAKPGGGRVYSVAQVSGGDTVAKARLTFTYLPIVEIEATGLSKQTFSGGTFRLSDPEGRDSDSTLRAKLRYRGDYTMLLDKKSFAVKFVGADGKKQDRQWLDMRKDNYWILDAMAVDHARMRNRVAMDLWNDMAERPYYASAGSKVSTGVHGRLVEVFLNGKYHGVYNFMERIDRKQLGLAKTAQNQARGCLYKSRQWDTWTLLGFDRYNRRPIGQRPPSFDNSSEVWNYWECKYPEPGKKTKAEWQPLYDAILLTGSSDDKTFCNNVDKTFDLPVVRDYYLFIELLHAVDNSGKNMYWAVADRTRSSMLTPAPWDLDGTFGRDWGGHRSGCDADNNYRQYLLNGAMQNALFERLHRLNPHRWNEQMASRYRQLRRTHFDPDKLYARFHTYRQLLQRSGAERREARRWANHNAISLTFDKEADFLKQWIHQRVATLDRQYGLN